MDHHIVIIILCVLIIIGTPIEFRVYEIMMVIPEKRAHLYIREGMLSRK